jgi:hypothetical protein
LFGRLYFDHHQFALDMVCYDQIGQFDHVNQLIELLNNLLDNIVTAACY